MKANDILIVKTIIQRNGVDFKTTSQIMLDIQEAVENQKEERPPAVKKQICLLTTGETGWAVKIPEDDNFRSCREKIIRAAEDFNMTPKGRRLPVRTIGEALETVPAKYFREHNIWILTKEPVFLQKVENSLKD